MTCWILMPSGRIGPLTEKQVAQRVRLGLVGSLDRISMDGGQWIYLHETAFWRQERTVVGSACVSSGPVREERPANPERQTVRISPEIFEKLIRPNWMEIAQ